MREAFVRNLLVISVGLKVCVLRYANDKSGGREVRQFEEAKKC